MSAIKQIPINRVREKGYRALLEKLGPVDYLRFLSDLGIGKGDCTLQRHRRLDHVNIDKLDRLIGRRRKRSQNVK